MLPNFSIINKSFSFDELEKIFFCVLFSLRNTLEAIFSLSLNGHLITLNWLKVLFNDGQKQIINCFCVPYKCLESDFVSCVLSSTDSRVSSSRISSSPTPIFLQKNDKFYDSSVFPSKKFIQLSSNLASYLHTLVNIRNS